MEGLRAYVVDKKPCVERKKSRRLTSCRWCVCQLGLWGYSAYSASKFALRGLAQALQMEVSLRQHTLSIHAHCTEACTT
jgi:NAD(P)-dependent dehydrogenase (short-subunit alcohol dehydrogenase family)